MMKINNAFDENPRKGKVATKSIHLSSNVESDDWKDDHKSNTDQVNANTAADKNAQAKKIKTECLERDFTKNFKPKSDTILLKLHPDYHVLSAEQQAFFVKLTEGIFGYNEQVRNEMLKILSLDYNIKALIPFLCIFIKETIHCNIVFTDLTLLIYSVRMTKSLLTNPYVKLTEHLHILLPAVLSCALAKKISKYHYDNHWTLRDFSAYVVGMICNLYGNKTNNIQQRVTELYMRPIRDCTKPLTTLYGAIKGISSLGEEYIKSYILPYIPFLGNRLYVILEKRALYSEEGKQQMNDAKHVKDAILNTVCTVLLKTRNINDCGLQYTKEFGYLGHSIYIQVKNLEKAELDKQKDAAIKSTGFTECQRVYNSMQNIGFRPQPITNFGIQYVTEAHLRRSNTDGPLSIYDKENMYKSNNTGYQYY